MKSERVNHALPIFIRDALKGTGITLGEKYDPLGSLMAYVGDDLEVILHHNTYSQFRRGSEHVPGTEASLKIACARLLKEGAPTPYTYQFFREITAKGADNSEMSTTDDDNVVRQCTRSEHGKSFTSNGYMDRWALAVDIPPTGLRRILRAFTATAVYATNEDTSGRLLHEFNTAIRLYLAHVTKRAPSRVYQYDRDLMDWVGNRLVFPQEWYAKLYGAGQSERWIGKFAPYGVEFLYEAADYLSNPGYNHMATFTRKTLASVAGGTQSLYSAAPDITRETGVPIDANVMYDFLQVLFHFDGHAQLNTGYQAASPAQQEQALVG